jgi:hypothetical protein
VFDTYVGAVGASPGPAGIARGPAETAPEPGGGRFSANSFGQDTTSADHLAAISLAGLFLAAGIGLFALRWAGRRV